MRAFGKVTVEPAIDDMTGQQWDVEVDAFTQEGFQDGAINTRIMTLAQLNTAKTNGDVFPIDIHTVFNCSSTNISTNLRGTPLSFTPH